MASGEVAVCASVKAVQRCSKGIHEGINRCTFIAVLFSGFVASDLGCEFDLGNVLKRVLHNFRRYGRRGEMAVLRRRHK